MNAKLLVTRGGGGWMVLKKVLCREAPPQGPNLQLLHTIFNRKGVPSIGSGPPFTYLQKKHYLFVVGCVRDILKGPFKYPNDSFPYPFLYFSL